LIEGENGVEEKGYRRGEKTRGDGGKKEG